MELARFSSVYGTILIEGTSHGPDYVYQYGHMGLTHTCINTVTTITSGHLPALPVEHRSFVSDHISEHLRLHRSMLDRLDTRHLHGGLT